MIDSLSRSDMQISSLNAEIKIATDLLLSLAEAIAKSGGLLDGQANPAGVFVFRPEPASLVRMLVPAIQLRQDQQQVNVIYRLDMRQPQSYFFARNFQVADKDTLYIATAPFHTVQKFVGVLS